MGSFAAVPHHQIDDDPTPSYHLQAILTAAQHRIDAATHSSTLLFHFLQAILTSVQDRIADAEATTFGAVELTVRVNGSAAHTLTHQPVSVCSHLPISALSIF